MVSPLPVSARSVAAVPGVAKTTPEFRAALWELASRNGWDVDGIAAVMSIESGFDPAAKNPSTTASGLIQMIDSTARSVGVGGGAAELRELSAVQQLPYVERYYKRAFFGLTTPRVHDFYLAGFGKGVGQADGYVLADENDPLIYKDGTANAYILNAGLDVSADGLITVGDIRKVIQSRLDAANGKRVDASAVALAGVGLDWFAAALVGGVLWLNRRTVMRWIGRKT